MLLNMNNISEALKVLYLPRLRYQFNDQASALLAQIEKNSDSVVGSEIRMALRYGRVGGIGNRDDDGTLPTPRARQTKQAVWKTKNIFARFQLTDKTIAASKTSVGAFANMLEQEITDCETDGKLDLSRQVLGDGIGTLATLTAAAATNQAVVAVDTTMYLAEGMLVDFLVPATGLPTDAAHLGLEILSVDSPTQITLTANITEANIADGNIVVIAGNLDAAALAAGGRELTGLAKVVSKDNTLYGINRGTAGNKWLNANVVAVNGQISENKIQQAIDAVETKSGSETNFLFCSKGVQRAYANLQTAMKQHVNTLELEGGWTGLSYAGGNKPIAIVGDKYVPGGYMYGLDLSDWTMHQMEDWGWLDKDGAMLSRVANKAAWEATLVKYCDLGCQRPRGQFVLTGITEM